MAHLLARLAQVDKAAQVAKEAHPARKEVSLSAEASQLPAHIIAGTDPAKLNAQTPYFRCPAWADLPSRPYHLHCTRDGVVLPALGLHRFPFYLFGKSAVCDYVLEHPSVSSVHAALVFHKERACFVLVDLGSTNGVRVNGGGRIEKQKPLPAPVGTCIQFGYSTRKYEVRLGAPPPRREKREREDEKEEDTGEVAEKGNGQESVVASSSSSHGKSEATAPQTSSSWPLPPRKAERVERTTHSPPAPHENNRPAVAPSSAAQPSVTPAMSSTVSASSPVSKEREEESPRTTAQPAGPSATTPSTMTPAVSSPPHENDAPSATTGGAPGHAPIEKEADVNTNTDLISEASTANDATEPPAPRKAHFFQLVIKHKDVENPVSRGRNKGEAITRSKEDAVATAQFILSTHVTQTGSSEWTVNEFVEAAQAYCELSNPKKKGDLGMVEEGTFSEEFDKAAFRLRRNEVSAPVETPLGIHLIFRSD